MSKRIYKVTNDAEVFMVRANNKSQAIRFVAEMTMACEVAGQECLVEHVAAGTKIHDATEQPVAESEA